MRWDPNNKPPGGNPSLSIGGWAHCFTILFSYWFSITKIKNPIAPNQEKPEVPHQFSPMFFIWGSFSNRKGLLIGAKNGDTKKINSRDFIGLGMGYSSNMYIYIIYAYIHYNIYMAMLMDKMMINHWIWGGFFPHIRVDGLLWML